MHLTDYHAKYFAHELTKRCPSDSAEKLAGALVDAQVDLNPHQVEAALFAFRSPLSRGALLADEVGLRKTIEAGLVISQRWAERKRRILVITPSNLRKQWHQELTEKFFLPCRILESRFYNESIAQGNFRPFEGNDTIVICSYQFARSKAADVSNTPWHLVVIDEAHRLRNVYKPSNVIANTLKLALKDAPKLLLTATPLQNSLLELFGLVSFVDEYAFGDLASFRAQFTHLTNQEIFDTLKARLRPMCHRTLRRQVTAYVPFTRRHPMVQPFTPEDSEDRLYHLVSNYLRRDNLQALPKSQRSLMTLVLRKLLASSSFAIAGALGTLGNRLKDRLRREMPKPPETELAEDYEALDETADEWPEDKPQPEPLSDADRGALEQEVADLEGFRTLAVSITSNAKGRALLVALDHAFGEAERLGAARKAIIFTESRRTQEYLLRILADSPYFHRDRPLQRLEQRSALARDLRGVAGAPRRYGSRERLSKRGHAVGARGLLPRRGPDHDRHGGGRGDQGVVRCAAGRPEPGAELRYGEALNEMVDERRAAIQQVISERNGNYFEAEAEKLDSWADDLKVALEREIKEMDRQIREARRKASQAGSLETKLAGQKQIKALEAQRTSKRRTLFDAQDQIDQRREVLIQGIEAKLAPKTHLEPLMAIRWALR